MVQNRRNFTRISKSDAPCEVTIGANKQVGRLIDESIGGARIGDINLLMLPVGTPVTVKHEYDTFHGICRSVHRGSNGLFEIGIQRVDEEDEAEVDTTPSRAMLVNCFFKHDDAEFVCIPLTREGDNQIRVRLWNGTEFVVPFDRIVPRTREERFRALHVNPGSRKLVQLYGLSTVMPATSAVDVVFDYEFGQLKGCSTTPRVTATAEK